MLLQTGDEFRAAIRAGNYGVADQLLGELRSQVEASWPILDAGERQEIAAHVLELLTWARQTTIVRRSQSQRKLSQITRHNAYAPNARRKGHLDMEA